MEDKISDSRKSLSVLNLLSNEWSSPNTTGETIEHRYSHSAVVYNGKMVIFGGRNNRSFFGDLCLLDLKTYKWRIQEDASGIYPTPRAKHSAVVHEQMMYIYGGWYNKRLGDLYAYNFLTSHWTKIVHHKGTIPSPRYAHHAVMKANGFMFIFGNIFCETLISKADLMGTFVMTCIYSIRQQWNGIVLTVMEKFPIKNYSTRSSQMKMECTFLEDLM